MRISLPLLTLCIAIVRAQEQQVPLGVSDNTLVEPDDAIRGPAVEFLEIGHDSPQPSTLIHPSAPAADETSAAELHAMCLSLLKSITSHASISTPTDFSTPVLEASAKPPILDLMEDAVGTTAGRAIRGLRTAADYLYSGSFPSGNKRKAGRDWSLTGTVLRIYKTFSTSSPKSSRDKSSRGTQAEGEQSWKSRLWSMGETDVLYLDEIEQGMRELVELAEQAGEKGHSQAYVLLGDLYLTGHLTLAPNVSLALNFYEKASERSGNPEAQYKLGFLYGTNFGQAVGSREGEGDQGTALLYYTFAALSGHVPASMTVGYRHWVGIGTKQSCQDALGWYKSAAEQAMKTFNAGPPGGRLLSPPKVRLSDVNGGVYGPGASASYRPQITGGSTSQTEQEWRDLVEFYRSLAERGDVIYMFRLGRLFYLGFGGDGLGGNRGGYSRLQIALPAVSDNLAEGGRDFRNAFRWFRKICLSVWAKEAKEAMTDPKAARRAKSEPPKLFYDGTKDIKLKTDEQTVMAAGLAAGFLGKMYLRGEGIAANYPKAFLWFMRGASQGDRESQNGLGIMFRDGLGVERDLKRANLFFQTAAQQDLAEAQVNLGKFHFGTGDLARASSLFEAAIRQDGSRVPDSFQSYFYLAELNARAKTSPGAPQCPIAVSFYKLVAERGDWEHEVWWDSERALNRKDLRTGLLGNWLMAERGYEPAQNNLAWILDRDKQKIRLPLIDLPLNLKNNDSDRVALTYWTRSAAQDNVDALLKMGDYYFNGKGTENVAQYEKAAACYQSAVTTRTSAMAMWNLGWMHENGLGVAKDLHLAKRYFDMAIENSADSFLPSTLSLIRLYARAIFHVIFSPDTEDETKALSLLRGTAANNADDTLGGFPPLPKPAASWSFSRVWKEIQRKWGIEVAPDAADGIAAPAPGQQAAAAGNAPTGAGTRRQDLLEAQRALEAEPAEEFNWRRAVDSNEDEDEFFIDGEGDLTGTIAILALCIILGWLFHFRAGRNGDAHEQRERERPNQHPVQPAPGDAPAEILPLEPRLV